MVDLNKYKGLSGTLLGLSCLLMTSCGITKTDYDEKFSSPESFGTLTNPSSALVTTVNSVDGSTNSDAHSLNFYKSFGDDKLNAIIEEALANNYDITSAYLNLQKAQVELGLANSNLHPTANASLSSSSRKDLAHGNGTSESSAANLGLSYELDLFGRLNESARSSFENYKASAYDYKAMRLTIIQRASEYYWAYAFYKEALKLAEDDLKASQKRLDLIKEKVSQGAADGLEYDQALVNHRAVEQTVYQRSYELTSAHNALCTVLGLFTDTNLDSKVQDNALEHNRGPRVEIALPASLLQKRPDLMAYEARVRSTYAGVDAAEANFFPQFNLNAGVGSGSSTSLARFLTDPIGTLGASITFPFLNYNQLSLQKDSALIARDQARLNFANGFITAVQEVSDSLNNLSYQELLIKSTSDELELTKNNYQRYLDRYRYGSASLSDMLDASDSLRSAQNKYLSSKRDLLNSSMALMVALGGDSFTKEYSSQNSSTAIIAKDNTTADVVVGSAADQYDPHVILQQAQERSNFELMR